jgi:hypothetical protein
LAFVSSLHRLHQEQLLLPPLVFSFLLRRRGYHRFIRRFEDSPPFDAAGIQLVKLLCYTAKHKIIKSGVYLDIINTHLTILKNNSKITKG